MDKTLVIMAAGLGSRYGGLKQVEPVGPDKSIIIDYSVFDAVRAGFTKVIFIIKEENEQIFREVIGDKVSKFIDVEYVFQKLDTIPEGFSVLPERVKPLGTAHAIYCCKDIIKTPFMVINADDFYGRECFRALSEWMDKTDLSSKPYKFAMAGFLLKNTLTENGTVSRGVCEVDENNKLVDVVERTKIKRVDSKIAYTEDGESWNELDENSYASMNCWCFPQEFLKETELYLVDFFKNELPKNPLKGEAFLPFLVSRLLKNGECEVDVIETKDKWFGVTYAEDKPDVIAAVRKLVDEKIYPETLWKE